jgi:hypothetical protein
MSYPIRHERILLEQAEQDRSQALHDQATTHAANLAEMQQVAETFRAAKEQTYNTLSVESQKALEAAQAETLRRQGEWDTEKKNLEIELDRLRTNNASLVEGIDRIQTSSNESRDAYMALLRSNITDDEERTAAEARRVAAQAELEKSAKEELRSYKTDLTEQKKSFEECLQEMEQLQLQQRLAYQKEVSEANDRHRENIKESKASGERTLQTMEKLYKDSISELRAQMSTKAAEYEQTIASLQFESDDRRKRILQQSNLLDLQRRL